MNSFSKNQLKRSLHCAIVSLGGAECSVLDGLEENCTLAGYSEPPAYWRLQINIVEEVKLTEGAPSFLRDCSDFGGQIYTKQLH